MGQRDNTQKYDTFKPKYISHCTNYKWNEMLQLKDRLSDYLE